MSWVAVVELQLHTSEPSLILHAKQAGPDQHIRSNIAFFVISNGPFMCQRLMAHARLMPPTRFRKVWHIRIFVFCTDITGNRNLNPPVSAVSARTRLITSLLCRGFAQNSIRVPERGRASWRLAGAFCMLNSAQQLYSRAS